MMTEAPILYSFDAITGEFLGVTKADLSPRPDPNGEYVWLYPANTTTVAPPEIEQFNDYVYCWTDGEWKQITDHRGKRVYTIDEKSKMVNSLGPVPTEYSIEKAPSPYHVVKDNQWTEDVALKKKVEEQNRREAAQAAAIDRIKSAKAGQISIEDIAIALGFRE